MKNVHYDLVKFNYTRNSPSLISWDITNRCNLRCKHCFNFSGDSCHHDFSNELTYEEAIDLAKQISSMKVDQCCFCGGEPMLVEYLPELIKIISSSGVKTNMVSNGTLMNEQNILILKKSGIENIQISLDGLGYQHDMFRNCTGCFEKAVAAIELLQKNHISLMVSFCPHKYNYHSVSEYIEFLYKIGCKTIRMMPLLPLGRGSTNYSDFFLNESQLIDLTQELVRLRSKYPNIKIEWGDPLEHLSLISLTKRRCPVMMNIKSNGDLAITPYINIVVGNIKHKSLLQYWSDGYNKIWSNPQIYKIVSEVKTYYDLANFSDKNFYYYL